MKAKIFALVAAFFMLMGGSAWAQSDVKGDVNKDGVVNEQDIAAILAIMAKNNGVAEKTKYYWIVGQENPASIGAVANSTTDKWTELGTSLSGISEIRIETTNSFGIWYVLMPNGLTGFVPGDSASSEESIWDKSASAISGYTLWTKKAKALKLATTFKKY
jgi:hypothetical protein